jgi:hypothetical protein
LFAGGRRRTKTNRRRFSAARLKIVERKTPRSTLPGSAVVPSLALVGSSCHDPQRVLTFVKAVYFPQWHTFVENDHVSRGLHVSGVLFDINACYQADDWGSSNGHRIAYLEWFGCHANSLPHADFSCYPWAAERGLKSPGCGHKPLARGTTCPLPTRSEAASVLNHPNVCTITKSTTSKAKRSSHGVSGRAHAENIVSAGYRWRPS